MYYLILLNQVDFLQKRLKKDHVHMRLWTRFYGTVIHNHTYRSINPNYYPNFSFSRYNKHDGSCAGFCGYVHLWLYSSFNGQLVYCIQHGCLSVPSWLGRLYAIWCWNASHMTLYSKINQLKILVLQVIWNIPGGPMKTEQSIQSVFQDFALINSYLFSPCWIEHLFRIIITPRSSNLLENFLIYE